MVQGLVPLVQLGLEGARTHLFGWGCPLYCVQQQCVPVWKQSGRMLSAGCAHVGPSRAHVELSCAPMHGQKGPEMRPEAEKPRSRETTGEAEKPPEKPRSRKAEKDETSREAEKLRS